MKKINNILGNQLEQIKKDGTFKIQEIVGCVFVKLIGRHGWKS